ncbi:MAG: recE [Streptomycetaceae bacterium]|nr:recE [Streptomycetaceae bacterium]
MTDLGPNPPAPEPEDDLPDSGRTGADGATGPAEDYRTKYAQEHRDEIRAQGKVPILAAELQAVDAMAKAIRAHPLASVLFDPDRGGRPEQTLFWTDKEFDVLRRARIDWLPAPRTDGRLLVPDYKSTASAEPAAFTKSVFAYGYDVQAVFYTDGVRALGLADDVAFLFVAQEKTAPFLVTVHQLDDVSLGIGRTKVDRALATYEECLLTGEWPGYSTDVDLVTPPPWLARQYEDLASPKEYAS